MKYKHTLTWTWQDLFLWCPLALLVSGILSWASALLLGLHGEHKAAFIVAGTFANSAALPMLVLDTLCGSSEEILQQMDEAECVNMAFSYINVYTGPFSVFMYGLALPLLKRSIPKHEAKDGTHSVEGKVEITSTNTNKIESPLYKEMFQSLSSPPIVATFIGIAVGLCRPVSDSLFTPGGFASPLGRALSSIGAIGVALQVMLMASALVYRPPPESLEVITPDTKSPMHIESSPQESGSEHQHALPRSEDNQKADTKASKFSWRAVAALCTLRLVVVPCVGFSITYFAVILGLFAPTGPGGLRALIVFIEWCVPSAQTIIVIMTQLEHHSLAKELGVVYLFMYPLSVITMTCWTALALFLIEKLLWAS